LNTDEFAVAMHLIYRKLNNYPIPARLPPELTPPSTRNLNDSLGTVKSLLQRDAEQRKASGAFLQPQKTGVSYLKSHSFRKGSPSESAKADATMFRNNDDTAGYRSSARRRMGADGRSPSPAVSDSATSEQGDLSREQILKLIKEKQILLDAIDFGDENAAEEDDQLDRRDRRDADELFRRIRRTQEDINNHPNSSKVSNSGSDAERRTLTRQLQTLNDRLPHLASQVRKCERAIADAQLELFRLKDAKAHPGSASIVGTGPGGMVTEQDRKKAKAKALMQQRTAALTGRPMPAGFDDSGASDARFESENLRVREEREKNERIVRDVEESVSEFAKSLQDSLKDGAPSSTVEHERRRWEDALGVEDEVRDFIFELQRDSQSFKRQTSARTEPSAISRQTTLREEPSSVSSNGAATSPSVSSMPALSAKGTSYSSYRTAEERAAYIKQQAEQRMAERLAALGIKTSKPAETHEDRATRERREQEERLRKAEEEDAKREKQRQQRLDEESIAPPIAKQAKKPPPPPSRKAANSVSSVSNEVKIAAEKEIKAEQNAQESETLRLEYVVC